MAFSVVPINIYVTILGKIDLLYRIKREQTGTMTAIPESKITFASKPSQLYSLRPTMLPEEKQSLQPGESSVKQTREGLRNSWRKNYSILHTIYMQVLIKGYVDAHWGRLWYLFAVVRIRDFQHPPPVDSGLKVPSEVHSLAQIVPE